MVKIKSLEELKRIKEQAQNSVSLRVKGDNIENMIQIRVAMATCGIASGAREVMNEFVEALGIIVFMRRHAGRHQVFDRDEILPVVRIVGDEAARLQNSGASFPGEHATRTGRREPLEDLLPVPERIRDRGRAGLVQPR